MGSKRVGYYCRDCGCLHKKKIVVGYRCIMGCKNLVAMYIKTKTPKSHYDETKKFAFKIYLNKYKKPGEIALMTWTQLTETLKVFYNEGFDLKRRMEENNV